MRSSYRLIFCRIAVGIIILALIISGCAEQEETSTPQTMEMNTIYSEKEASLPEKSEENSTISIAVFPYLPDMELFERILTKQWEELEPDVELNFVDWDCYISADPSGIDVITYDALFTSYLAENGYIQSIERSEIQDEEGIFSFAMDGAVYNEEIYGVPFLVCSYFLMHDAEDEAMSEVDNFSELYSAVSGKKAVDGTTGLLTNFDINFPYFYLDAMMDFSGEYTDYEKSPDTASPDEQVMRTLSQIPSILAAEPENYAELATFRRAALFNDGYGCAYYGYSEDISFMDDICDDITIRTISFSENENIQLFFADIVSVGAHVTDSEKKANCKKLMNLIASEKFLQELCFGSEEAQYMLPARYNIYAEAEQTYPIYGRLYELAMNEQNRIFRFGLDIYSYFNEVYANLAY